MLRGVIFDVDGTLVDSVDLHAIAWEEAFREFGYKLDFTEVRHQVGKGADKIIPYFLSPADLEKIGKQLEEFRTELYLRQFLPQVRPFPKVRELFERIGSDGRRIALATSAKAVELGSLRQMLNVDDLVDYVVDAGDVKKSKPDSDVFECALSGLSISADEAIAVGDTPYDAKAATKIHVRCIGLLCGGFPEAELWQAGCIEIYRDPAELLECYERSSLSEERLAA